MFTVQRNIQISFNLACFPVFLLLLYPLLSPKRQLLQDKGERWRLYEPSHEIMVLFILRKLLFQTCMCSHPVGLDLWFLVVPFVYFHILRERITKALVRLCGCAGSPEPSLVAYVISTITSWAGSYYREGQGEIFTWAVEVLSASLCFNCLMSSLVASMNSLKQEIRFQPCYDKTCLLQAGRLKSVCTVHETS